MDSQLQTYLSNLIFSRYPTPANVFLINPDDIVSVKAVPLVSPNANTTAYVTMTNGTVRQVTYNRQTFSSAIIATVGYHGFTLAEFTEATVAEFLTTNGLAITAEEIKVTKLGEESAKIDCTDKSVRYYGGIAVTISSNGDISIVPESLAIDAPHTLDNVPAIKANVQNDFIYSREINTDTKVITVTASGTIDVATAAIPFPLYFGDSVYADKVKGFANTDPERIVMKLMVGGEYHELTPHEVNETLSFDEASGRYFLPLTLTTLYNPMALLSVDKFVTQTQYQLVLNVNVDLIAL